MPFGITLSANFYARIVIAAGNTGLSGKGAAMIVSAPSSFTHSKSLRIAFSVVGYLTATPPKIAPTFPVANLKCSTGEFLIFSGRLNT